MADSISIKGIVWCYWLDLYDLYGFQPIQSHKPYMLRGTYGTISVTPHGFTVTERPSPPTSECYTLFPSIGHPFIALSYNGLAVVFSFQTIFNVSIRKYSLCRNDWSCLYFRVDTDAYDIQVMCGCASFPLYNYSLLFVINPKHHPI